jgi:hypothetical protein
MSEQQVLVPARPGHQRGQRRKVVGAALTLPGREGQVEDEFTKRMVPTSLAKSSRARCAPIQSGVSPVPPSRRTPNAGAPASPRPSLSIWSAVASAPRHRFGWMIEDALSRVTTAVDFSSASHAGAEQIAKTLETDGGVPAPGMDSAARSTFPDTSPWLWPPACISHAGT